MRQNNNNNHNNNNNNRNRTRGRGRKSSNPMNRNFESNGPDVKIRGNAGHIAEKYTNLARDALTSGDPVMAENYYQHAEHYNRIVALAQANNPTPPPAKTGDDNRNNNGSGPQPDVEGVPDDVTLAEGDEAEAAKEANASSGRQRTRRNGASKPKQDDGDSEETVVEASSEPSSEEEAEPVEAKPRSRNRRPRARRSDNISDDAAKLPGSLTAAPAEVEEEAPIPVAVED